MDIPKDMSKELLIMPLNGWTVMPPLMLKDFSGVRGSEPRAFAAGEFTGSADGRALSVSSAFSGKPVPVIVRFSVGGANPKAADNAKSQRNMALQFNLPGGETWQMGNISAPVFGAATPEQFLGRLQSLQPDPATKMPDPAKVKTFADANPEVLLQGRYFASQPVPASFGTVNYWGVHAFAFVNGKGDKQFGKWIFEPVGGTKSLSDDEVKAKGPSFLFDDLRQRVKDGKVAFEGHDAGLLGQAPGQLLGQGLGAVFHQHGSSGCVCASQAGNTVSKMFTKTVLQVCCYSGYSGFHASR